MRVKVSVGTATEAPVSAFPGNAGFDFPEESIDLASKSIIQSWNRAMDACHWTVHLGAKIPMGGETDTSSVEPKDALEIGLHQKIIGLPQPAQGPALFPGGQRGEIERRNGIKIPGELNGFFEEFFSFGSEGPVAVAVIFEEACSFGKQIRGCGPRVKKGADITFGEAHFQLKVFLREEGGKGETGGQKRRAWNTLAQKNPLFHQGKRVER
jgi:hypothetical protein